MRQGLYLFNITTYKAKTAKDMTSFNEFRLRKAHWEGEGNACCCLNIPKPFWQRMEIDRQSYLKVTYLDDGNKLMVEKLIQ